MNPYSETDLIENGWTDPTERKAFTAFMQRVDNLVTAMIGMGVDNFADADWASLYEDQGADVTATDIVDLLSDADPIFASLVALHWTPQ